MNPDHDTAMAAALSLLESVEHLAPRCEHQWLFREFYATVRAVLEVQRSEIATIVPSVN